MCLQIFSQTIPTLVYPKNNFVKDTSAMNFVWNTLGSGITYELNIATDTMFKNSFKSVTTTNNYSSVNGFVNGTTYYWRVRNVQNTNWSLTRKFTSFNPKAPGNLELWLKADIGVKTDGNLVYKWEDQSGKGNNATQQYDSLKPTYNINSDLNGKPVIRFGKDGKDGSTTFFNIPKIDLTNRNYTIIIVYRMVEKTTYSAILSDNEGGTDIYKGLISSGGTHPLYLNYCIGNLDLNGDVTMGSNAPKLWGIMNFYRDSIFRNTNQYTKPIKISSPDSISFNTIGAAIGDKQFNIGFFYGDIYEIIIYSKKLNQNERNLVSKYLLNKTISPLNLGNDINKYGFCSTSLTPGYYPSGFTYQWINTSTSNIISNSNTINVSDDGIYKLKIANLNLLNYSDSDIIKVTYPKINFPLNNSKRDTTICYGKTLNWDSKLSKTDGYTFKWSEGSTNSTISITKAGKYSVKVIDSTKAGCSLLSDTLTVKIDSFPAIVSLQNAIPQHCRYDTLRLIKGADQALPDSYIWNTGSTKNYTIIDTTGVYKITVKSTGCTANTSIKITVNGAMPIVDFKVDTACVYTPMHFVDKSTPYSGDMLSSWNWDFGDGSTISSTSTTMSHQYSNLSGSVPVKHTATTKAGCSRSETKNVMVYSINMNFSTNLTFVGDSTFFTNLSTSVKGDSVLKWTWDFGDNSSSYQKEPHHKYNNIGIYNVTLTANSKFGCPGTINRKVFVYDTIQTFNAPELVYPDNNLILSDTNITFLWNELKDTSSLYQIQIDTNTNFNSTVYNVFNIITPSFKTNLLSGKNYYWRVKAFNGTNCSQWSIVRSFSFFNPSSIGKLYLWLRSDLGVKTLNNKVIEWKDQSGNNYHAQSDTLYSPDIKYNVLNYLPSIRFNGINEFLIGSVINGIDTNSFSLFIVASGNKDYPNQETGLFSIIDKNKPIGSQNFLINHYANTNGLICRNNDGYIRTTDNSFPIDGFPVKIIEYFKNYNVSVKLLINGNILPVNIDPGTGNSLYKNFIPGNYYIGKGSQLFHGDIFEVIVFKKFLSDSIRKKVEKYIKDKYFPSLNLGQNIYKYGFCDTIINAPMGFSSLVWSDGTSGSSISINKSDSITLTAINNFGDNQHSSVKVFYPNPNILKDTTNICLGDTLLWNTGMGGSIYSFEWQDGSTDSKYKISKTGNYWVKIRSLIDTCPKILGPYYVYVDDFKNNVKLGTKENVCYGDKLTLQSGNDLVKSYIWSTGETSSQIYINKSDIYTVKLTSKYNCITNDTIKITIQGASPLSIFVADTVCIGDSTHFTNNTTSSNISGLNDTIIKSYFWIFEDQTTSDKKNPVYKFSSPGVHTITLVSTSGFECSSSPYKKNIYVVNVPDVLFDNEIAFKNDTVNFFDKSTTDLLVSDNIINWKWEINNSDFFNDNISYVFDSSGVYNIKLSISTKYGCSANTNKDIIIYNTESSLPPVALVSPYNNNLLQYKKVTYIWEKLKDNLSTYQLQVSTDTDFTNIIGDYKNLKDTFKISEVPREQTYYWRVRAFNLSEYSDWSKVWKFGIFNPKSLPNLELWLESDIGVNTDANNKVIFWVDQSDKKDSAFQKNTFLQPEYISKVINGIPAIKFGKNGNTGDQTVLNLQNYIKLSGGNFTVFIVSNTIKQEYINTILTGYNISGSKNWEGLIFNGGKYSSYRGYGLNTGPLICTNKIQSFSQDTSTNWTIKTYYNDKLLNNGVIEKSMDSSCYKFSTGTNQLSLNAIGAYSGDLSYFFNGNIAEIIIYSNKLSDNSRDSVQNYLKFKYAPPPVNLGADITMKYGLKDTTLVVSNDYIAYSWYKDGILLPHKTHNISVSSSGNYKVSVIDKMGYFSTYSIKVTKPEIQPLNKNVFCNYDSLIWNPGLGKNYNYLWQDNSNDTILVIKNKGTYSVTVTDNYGYKKSLSKYIDVDNYSTRVSIVKDTSVCSGKKKELLNAKEETVNYKWSDSTSNSFLIVNAGGKYTVTVKDLNLCEKILNTNITVKGATPKANFSADTVCMYQFMNFKDCSKISNIYYADDNINFWNWIFEDSITDVDNNTKHKYSFSGFSAVKLIVKSQRGCSDTIIKQVKIIDLPEVKFKNTLAYVDGSTYFYDLTEPALGDSIIGWKWNIDNTIYTSKNPVHSFRNKGTAKIKLIVYTKYKGVDSLQKEIYVYSNESDLNENVKLVYPKNGINVGDTNINFMWNQLIDTSSFYEISISENNDFGNMYYHSDTVNALQITVPLKINKTYFWKVRCFNKSNYSNWSETWTVSTINPSFISGLKLWLKADAVIDTINGKISIWKDISGNNNNAYQSEIDNRPILVKNHFNKLPSVLFDGINDYLCGNKIDSIENKSLTLFVMFSGNMLQSNISREGIFTISDNSQTGYTKGFSLIEQTLNQGLVCFNNDSYIRTNSDTFSNKGFVFKIVEIEKYFNNKTEIYINSTKVGTVIDNSNNLLYDKFINNKYYIGKADNYFNGYINEIIIYDKPLNDNERGIVEKYLKNKYTPKVNLGQDVYVYNFCDTILTAPNNYVNYYWSTGETTKSININKAGTYSLSVKDINGNISYDTINVYYPLINKYTGKNKACIGDTLNWDIGLGSAFNYLWSDSSTASEISIVKSGIYSVTISDKSKGCPKVVTSDSIVFSNYSKTATLGPLDTSFCAGNKIKLIKGAEETVSYLWNDKSTGAELQIDSSGTYYLKAENVNNCSKYDTINVHIIGKAPRAGFISNSFVCLDSNIIFRDTSKLQGNKIINWLWNFGDSTTSTFSSISHPYKYPGDKNVTLTIKSDNSCSNVIKKQVRVVTLPKISFTPIEGCSNINTKFAFIGDADVNSWIWDFGDTASKSNNFSTLPDPLHKFNKEGFYKVILTGKTKYCQNNDTNIIKIKSLLDPEFTYSSDCHSNTVSFNDLTKSTGENKIFNWKWDFGDNRTSNLNNPVHIYDNKQKYTVSLSVTSINGCTSSSLKSIKLNEPPQAYFNVTNSCINNPIMLYDSSIVDNDTIYRRLWEINNKSYSKDKNISVSFSDTGSYKISLIVSTSSGCNDTVIKNIRINSIPKPFFSFSPEYGLPPLNVTFNNLSSSDASKYIWRFGDGAISNLKNPLHTYQKKGKYYITLTSYSITGCYDSIMDSINVIKPYIDIAVSNLNPINDGKTISVKINVTNNSNVPVHSIDFRSALGSSNIIWENWKGNIEPDKTFLYSFKSSFEQLSDYQPSHLCVSVSPTSLIDEVPENNQMCIQFTNEFKVYNIYPNPSDQYINIEYVIPTADIINIDIYNLLGAKIQKVFSGSGNEGYNSVIQDISNLEKGFYILKITYKSNEFIGKFIKN
ncbi:MAG: PKD domain-containing protein [Bacteroidota bacterium]|nr:PKD domain-containing protein [Bacteroidota bacterium]